MAKWNHFSSVLIELSIRCYFQRGKEREEVPLTKSLERNLAEGPPRPEVARILDGIVWQDIAGNKDHVVCRACSRNERDRERKCEVKYFNVCGIQEGSRRGVYPSPTRR